MSDNESYDFTDERPRGYSSRLAGQDRKAVVTAVCEQQDRKDMGFTIEAMRLPLEALGYDIVTEFPVFGMFDKTAIKKNHEVSASATEQGRALAESLLKGQ